MTTLKNDIKSLKMLFDDLLIYRTDSTGIITSGVAYTYEVTPFGNIVELEHSYIKMGSDPVEYLYTRSELVELTDVYFRMHEQGNKISTIV